MIDLDDLAAAGDMERKRKREDAMFPRTDGKLREALAEFFTNYAKRNPHEIMLMKDEALMIAAALQTPQPEAAAWRQVPDVHERQVAWIDNDAKYVAVVEKGREFILELPSRTPQEER